MTLSNVAERLSQLSSERRTYILSALTEHLLQAGHWQKLDALLCSLEFVEAKCAAGMVYELVRDYSRVLVELPEAHKTSNQKDAYRQLLARDTDRLVAYAAQCTEKRRRAISLPHKTDALFLKPPPLPRLFPSSAPGSAGVDTSRTASGGNSFTRLERIADFARFVDIHAHVLARLGTITGFCLQEAWHYADTGPVAVAASALLASRGRTNFLLERAGRSRSSRPRQALLRTLRAHTGPVTAVKPTADGSRAISASADGTLRYWDLTSGQCLGVLRGHTTDEVSAVALTPEGRYAVSGGRQIVVEHTPQDKLHYSRRVWDVLAGRCVSRFPGHSSGITDIAITPDGGLAVSSSQDMTLRVWDIVGRTCLYVFEHAAEVHYARVTPDGQMAVSLSGTPFENCEDFVFSVWDLSRGQRLRVIPTDIQSISGFCASPDGLVVAQCTWGCLSVWDLSTGQRIWHVQDDERKFEAVDISWDGKLLVSVSGNDVCLWESGTGRLLKTFDAGENAIKHVSITPDARLAVTGDLDHCIQVWDLERGHDCSQARAESDYVEAVELTPNGHLAVSAGRALCLWNARTGQHLQTLAKHKHMINVLELSPDGTAVAAVALDEPAYLWSIETGERLGIFKGHLDGINCIRFSLDGTRAISAGGGIVRSVGDKVYPDDYRVRLWYRHSAKCLAVLDGHTMLVSDVHFSPSGRIAASASWDQTVRIWDLEGGVLLGILSHEDSVYRVRMTPDGAAVVSISSNTIAVWDLANRQRLRRLSVDDNIRATDLSATGTHVLVAINNRASLWDLKTGRCAGELPGGPSEIVAVKLSVDSDHCLVADADGVVRLGDLTTWRWIAALDGGTGISALARFRHDGQFAMGTVRGRVEFIRVRGYSHRPPLVVPVNLWLGAPAGTEGRWDAVVSAACGCCGNRFRIADRTVERLRTISAQFSRPRRPCLELPQEAWTHPRLLSRCRRCRCPVRFSPFIVEPALELGLDSHTSEHKSSSDSA